MMQTVTKYPSVKLVKMVAFLDKKEEDDLKSLLSETIISWSD